MFLMITTSSRAREFSTEIEHALSEETEIANSSKKALVQLRSGEYSAVILDEAFVESEPDAVDLLLHHSGMAVPVYVNLAISSTQRVIREVKVALRRQDEARMIALRAAESLLRTEIRGAITGILLSTELALKCPELPSEAAEKLRSVCQLASDVRTRLETVQ